MREVKEELGVEIEVDDTPSLLATSIYGADGEYRLAISFEARIVAGNPRPADEPADDVAEIKWVSSDELDDLGFAWEHDRELVRSTLDGA